MINQGYLDSITLYQLDKRTLFVFVAMQVPQTQLYFYTNPSRKRSFLKTLFKPKEMKALALRFSAD